MRELIINTASSHHKTHIRGHIIHYWSYGEIKTSLPTLVFVHGFSGNHRGFYKIIPSLAPNYHVIAVDLPGFGASTTDSKILSVEEHAKAMVDFISSLQLPRTPIVIGHSYGTLVVAMMHRLSPELSDHKTILISPIPTPVGYKDRRMVGRVLGQANYKFGASTGAFGKWWLKRRIFARIGTWLLITTKDPGLRKEIHNEHFNNLGYLHQPRHYHALYKELNQDGIISHAPLIKKDVLIITGEKDNAAPLGEQQKAARVFEKQTLKVIKEVGHLAHYEKPDKISAEIDRFIS